MIYFLGENSFFIFILNKQKMNNSYEKAAIDN